MRKWLAVLLPLSAPLLSRTGPHLVVPPVAGVVADGDLTDWPTLNARGEYPRLQLFTEIRARD